MLEQAGSICDGQKGDLLTAAGCSALSPIMDPIVSEGAACLRPGRCHPEELSPSALSPPHAPAAALQEGTLSLWKAQCCLVSLWVRVEPPSRAGKALDRVLLVSGLRRMRQGPTSPAPMLHLLRGPLASPSPSYSPTPHGASVHLRAVHAQQQEGRGPIVSQILAPCLSPLQPGLTRSFPCPQEWAQAPHLCQHLCATSTVAGTLGFSTGWGRALAPASTRPGTQVLVMTRVATSAHY